MGTTPDDSSAGTQQILIAHDAQKMTTTVVVRQQQRRQARRQYRQAASIATMAVLAALYLILLLFRAEPRAADLPLASAETDPTTSQRHLELLDEDDAGRGRTLSKEGSHRHFLHASLAHDFSEYSCEDMHEIESRHGPLSKSAQCDFAKTCNEGDGIFAPIIFCHPTLSTRTLMLLLSPPLILFLLVLFRILGSTAEEFFSPGLEMFSLKMGLPERFAGVTLLALGNGAPDVASTVNAILDDRKRGYLMALGELTGAAMVASTLIVGAVTYVSDGVVCRGSLVRDVVVFMLTMAFTYAAFEDGTIDVVEIRCFVGIYVAYVLIVLLSDIYHRHVVVPRRRRGEGRKGEKEEGSDGTAQESLGIEMEADEKTSLVAALTSGKASNGAVEGGVAVAPQFAVQVDSEVKKGFISPSIDFGIRKAHRADPKKPIANIERVIEAMSNYDVESNENSSEEEDQAGDIESATENGEDKDAAPQKSKNPKIIHRESSSGWGERDEDGSEPLMVFHPHHGGLVNLKHAHSFDHHLQHHDDTSSFATEYHDCQQCIEGEPGPAPDGWGEAFGEGWNELVRHLCKLWDETYGSPEYNVVEKFLITCEMPFTVLRMLSIPVPCDGYYCRPLVAISIALSPLWMWYYCWNQFGISIINGSAGSILLVIVLPLLAGLSVLRYAPCGEVPMRLSVAVPITIIGFAVSAAWLDLIADKLVSLLSFFGIVLHIPSTIMGITVLAWGNSSQDMIANMTVAKKGLSAMAITASFAGPVFNILVGLGIGLTILNQTGESGQPIPVELNNPLRVGFLFAVLNGVLVIVSGVCVGKGTIPKHYGYWAMALYGVYAVASLTL